MDTPTQETPVQEAPATEAPQPEQTLTSVPDRIDEAKSTLMSALREAEKTPESQERESPQEISQDTPETTEVKETTEEATPEVTVPELPFSRKKEEKVSEESEGTDLNSENLVDDSDMKDMSTNDHFKALHHKYGEKLAEKDRLLKAKSDTINIFNERFPDPVEAEKALKELDYYRDNALITDLKSTKQYQDQIKAPKDRATADMNSVAQDYGVDLNIEQIGALKGRELGQALDKVFTDTEMDSLSKKKVIDSVDAWQKTTENQKLLEADAETAVKQAQQADHDKYSTALNRYNEASTGDNGLILQEMSIPETATAEERKFLEQNNESLKNISTVAQDILFKVSDPDEMASVAHDAATFRHMKANTFQIIEGLTDAIVKQLKESQSEVVSLKGAKHKLSNRGGDSDHGNKPATVAEMKSQLKNALHDSR